jgi:hypothetical protein
VATLAQTDQSSEDLIRWQGVIDLAVDLVGESLSVCRMTQQVIYRAVHSKESLADNLVQ